MTSLITEAYRHVEEGSPVVRLFDKSDGAARIFMLHAALPAQFHIGLHHHEATKSDEYAVEGSA